MQEPNSSPARDDMENIAPPPPPPRAPGEPRQASPRDLALLREALTNVKSIAGAASLYRGACDGADSYENNCAHFLSDAFLRAGYSNLKAPADCISARCETGAKRPIRARDMWCWFKQMATKTKSTLPAAEGMWAVFQLDEATYWGGHVLIFDSDKNLYFGTGHYPNWSQHCYQW
jgi:hypothetical protein